MTQQNGRFVYIARENKAAIHTILNTSYADIKMTLDDSREKKKPREYVIKGFSSLSDLALIEEATKFTHCERMKIRGETTSWVKAQWNDEDDPPPTLKVFCESIHC